MNVHARCDELGGMTFWRITSLHSIVDWERKEKKGKEVRNVVLGCLYAQRTLVEIVGWPYLQHVFTWVQIYTEGTNAEDLFA